MADDGQQQGQGQGEGDQGKGAQNDGMSYEEWLEGQEEAVQGLVKDHEAGLRSALQSERQERRKFERVGGFDVTHLPGSLFALDLAFRLGELGLISVYTPVAQVQCRDSRTFPSPDEIEYMWSRWSPQIERLQILDGRAESDRLHHQRIPWSRRDGHRLHACP